MEIIEIETISGNDKVELTAYESTRIIRMDSVENIGSNPRRAKIVFTPYQARTLANHLLTLANKAEDGE